MKTKIFLLILIFGAGYSLWSLFVDNFSQKPIEIIPNSSSDNSVSENVVSSEVVENTENQTEGAKTEKLPVVEVEEDMDNDSLPQSEENEDEVKDLPIEEEGLPAQEDNRDNSFITNKKISWGYSVSTDREIDTLVIHSSYDALGAEPYNLDGLIDEYKQYGVAPHFLIDRKGVVYRLVDEKNIAYHAGVSQMPDGRTGANNFSIGIELMNTKEDDYTKNQYSVLNKLVDYLEKQYDIEYVLGHQDISPDRKTDPWNFDWKKMDSKNAIYTISN